MHIIIVGCGKVGSSLAENLIEQDHDVVIVESDSDLIQNATELNCIKISGVPIDRDVLKQAGVETADIVCAVTQSDNINIMVSQIASDVFSVPKTITRIFNPANRDVFDAFGLNTVCSTELTVQAFMRKIAGETEERVVEVCQTSVMFSQVEADEDLVGEDISQLTSDAGKLIFGVLREGVLHLAVEGVRIRAGDHLVLAEIQ